MATQYLPVWDGRLPWDRKPISVRLEDWGEFMRVNQVRVVKPLAVEGVGWDVKVAFTHEVNDVDEGTADVVGGSETRGEKCAVEQRTGEGSVGERGEARKAGEEKVHQASLWDGVEGGGIR